MTESMKQILSDVAEGEHEARHKPIPRYLQKHLYFSFIDVTQGQRIQDARQWMRLNQTELGDLLDVSQDMVSRMENGKLANPPFIAGLFCEVFRRHLGYIFEGREELLGYGNQKKKRVYGVIRRLGK